MGGEVLDDRSDGGALIFDPAVLDGYRELVDETSPNLIAELITAFLQDLPGRQNAILTAIQGDDGPALRSAAHALKGSAATMGAIGLVQICQQLEHLGTSGAVGEAQGQTPGLDEMIAQTRDWLGTVEA